MVICKNKTINNKMKNTKLLIIGNNVIIALDFLVIKLWRDTKKYVKMYSINQEKFNIYLNNK